ncbi:MAG: cation-translocating P-type ATPase, partial [Verrucomicrobiales bacterium]|nr:cation-translocating P-type ATPase [Verrucomicrobiales bacterium]
PLPTPPAGIPPTSPPALDGDGDGAAPLGPASVERDLVFVGLAGMYDPPRPEVRTAIGRCQAAGIRVVMITGDHPVTASAVAREIGLTPDEGKVISGVELDQLSGGQLRERVRGTSVFARVTAEHKLRIVRAWRANEAVVAMTGDGVNDAPAIKAADIGIAMGRTGTEVTRQASDMIVTDDNFATIVAAVEEGRGIYDNIRKTLQYLLAGNTGEVLVMTVAVVAGYPAPLLPIHLLWINLVTDGLPALCLATDPVDPSVMKRRPRHRSQQITDRHFVRTTALTGLLTAGVAAAAYLHGMQSGTVEQARTAAFAVLVYAELLRAFGSRSATRPLWQVRLFSNPNLAIVVVMSFALQIWSHHNVWLGRFLQTSPVPFLQEFGLIALGSIPMLVLEVWKMVSLRNGPAGPTRHPPHHESEPSLHPLPA